MPTTPVFPPGASRTRAIRYGWIAAKLAGYPGRSVPAFLRDQVDADLIVSEDIVEAEIRPIRAPSRHKAPRGLRVAAPEESGGGPRWIWTDWLRVDESGLGIRKSLIRIPNDGLVMDELVEFLRRLEGVRQVLETAEDNEVFAIVLCRTEAEEENIRARIREHVPSDVPVRMHRIKLEDNAPAARTWLRIARDEASSARANPS